MAWAVLVFQFLMRCASSRTTISGWSRAIHIQRVAQHLLVIDDREKRRGIAVHQSRCRAAKDELIGKRGEPLNLLLPFGLQRGRRDDQHALGFPRRCSSAQAAMA